MKKPEIIILVGNIGTGKTTTIKKLISEGLSHIVISRDDLRYMIGAGKYRFDPKLEEAIWKTEHNMVSNFMKLKTNIIVDEVGVSKKMRRRYIKLAKKYNYRVTAILMPFMTKQDCVDRRMKNPHDCPNRSVWEGVWDKFNSLYQLPTLKEGINRIIHV